jgi:O-acetyl-ADP-ribose deacetylase (regulator of RNase III)
MIQEATGNMLLADVEALVHPVNCEGVLTRTLGRQFRAAFPMAIASYEAACRKREIVIGSVHVASRTVAPKFIISVPIRRLWYKPSRLPFVEKGLAALVAELNARNIKSIAMPLLCFGHSGPAHEDVRELINRAFAPQPEIHVLLYPAVRMSTPDSARSKNAEHSSSM